MALALAFCGLLWWWLDGNVGRGVADAKALEFLTGYLIEMSLSVDNIFVFIMIFSFFAVPPAYQRRVLVFGVLGAIVMRAAMILGGAWLVHQFEWVLYLFGAFLVVTGFKMLIFAEAEADLGANPVLKWMRRHLRIGGEAAVIRAARLEATSEKGNTRAGPRERAELVANERITATLEWDHALGLYDFEQNQHRSYVRLPHVAVRGASGEISDDRVRLVHGLDEIRTVHLERVVAGQDGDLSGHELMGITGLDGWAWRNRFMGARLADDEIAVAECLVHMAAHVEGADGFYHVADAAQDHYLWLCLQQAAASGETVQSEVQPWVDQLTAR